MTKKSSHLLNISALLSLIVMSLATFATRGNAQQTQADALPDAPSLTLATTTDADLSSSSQSSKSPQQGATPAVHVDEQPKRIFGILPNFRAVTAGTVLPPQTVKDKFVTATQDSFDYSSFLLASVVAVEAYGTNATPEFHTGGAAYGRYFWHTFVDQTSENYFVEFIVPTIAHEDTRYYTLGKGGFVKRTVYSIGHTFITKSDSGKTVFNSGEILGAAAASAVSNLYYPSPERTFGNTMDKFGTNIGIDAISFFFREFVPDIDHALFHEKTPSSNNP